MNTYKLKNFKLYELVPKDIYNLRKKKCIELFTFQILITIDIIRKELDRPITVNNWYWGGNLSYRGFRPVTYYNNLSLSQHIRGNAFDFEVEGFTANQAREEIIRLKREGKLIFLTGMELDIDWVHIDCRLSNRLNKDGLFLFKP